MTNIDHTDLLKHIFNSIFAISPIIGFIPQLVTLNIVFSPLLSLMLVLSAILRLYFRKIEVYSFVLIVQSVVMIITQLILIYNYKYKLDPIESKFFKKFNIKASSLFKCNLIIVSSVVLTLNILLFVNIPFIHYSFGILSVFLESSVGVMQLYMRRANKELIVVEDKNKRLPKELFACWIVGDVIKLYLMYTLPSPMIFTLPVIFQIGIDFLLMLE